VLLVAISLAEIGPGWRAGQAWKVGTHDGEPHAV
jgi:hypothetical protein